MKKIISLSLFILILTLSCSDVSDFLFETEQNVEIETVENGTIFRGGDSFSLTIIFDREIIPDSFTVAIIDSEGVNWGETDIELSFIEEEYLTSLVIPEELPPAKYHFHIRFFENGQEILYKEITIFVIDEDYIIEQLYSMPYETIAGKDVYIKADINAPEESDPYLRWRLNDIVLFEGLLSEGADTLLWVAEEKYGLYEIILELFPGICDSSFKSSISASTEIIVSDKPVVEVNSLKPEEEYSLLFHFSGDLKPTDEFSYSVSQFGLVKSHYSDGFLGYFFSNDSGLSVRGDVFPEESGKLTPFSVNGRLTPIGEWKGGNIFSLVHEDKTLISLTIDEDGFLLFSINDNTSRSKFILSGMTDISLSVIPDESGAVEIRWFYNGINGGSDYLFESIPDIPEDYEVIIGGSEEIIGADIFLDELGIYVGDKISSYIDGSQFSRIKEYFLGDDLIFSAGFDGLSLGDDFIAIENELTVENGNLMVEPGNTILINEFKRPIIDTDFIFSFPELLESEDNIDKWKLYVTNEEGELLFDFSSSDTSTEVDPETGITSRKLRFSLVTDESYNNEQEEVISVFFETDIDNDKTSLIDFLIIFTNIDSIISEKVVTTPEEETFL